MVPKIVSPDIFITVNFNRYINDIETLRRP